MIGNQRKIGIGLLAMAMAAVFFAVPIPAMAEEETQKEKLPTPQNVSISDNWVLSFDSVPEAKNFYYVKIDREDGQEVAFWGFSAMEAASSPVMEYPIAEYICDSGTYFVSVAAWNGYDPDQYEDSEYSEPVSKIYVRPSTQLGSTVGVWDLEKPGVLNFVSVEGASGYKYQLFQVSQQGQLLSKGGVSFPAEPGDTQSLDLSDRIERFGEGRYIVKICALSSNIDETANGEWGEASDLYDTKKQAAATDEIISDAMSGEATASEALYTLIGQVEKDKLKTDMQANDKVLGKIKELEEKYAGEKGIRIEKTISAEAAEYVDPENVSVTGAGLNVDEGTVLFDISIPGEKVEISGERYAKSVQFDIKLKNGDNEIHDLKVPVTIIMPVPEGLEAKHLIILHYHGTGEPERVEFKDNNDGTVTFTVKDFSTFVFAQSAEALEEESKQPETETRTETQTPEENWEEETEGNADEENAASRSPKTADTGRAGFWFGIFAASLLVMSAVYDGRKKNVK